MGHELIFPLVIFRHAAPTADAHPGVVGAPALVGPVVRAVLPPGAAADRPLLEQHGPRPGKCFPRPKHLLNHPHYYASANCYLKRRMIALKHDFYGHYFTLLHSELIDLKFPIKEYN